MTIPELERPRYYRIVVKHPDGLMRIIGWADRQPPAFLPAEGEREALCLVTAKARYFVYQPLMLPNMAGPNGPTGGSFDPRQR